MTDHNTIERQKWLGELDRTRKERTESNWWWAIGIVALVLLFMLVSRVGPVVFPAG